MTNAKLRLLLLAGTAVRAAAPALAQTGSTTAHHTASTTAHHTGTAAHPVNGCVTVPTLSPKVPALPTGSPCPKALFTVSERLDAISPLVGPDVREGFSNLPMIFTLAYVDTKIGTGELAKPKMFYTVNYTGYLTDGTKFDSSYDHPDKKPISFPYGAHRVIPGWDTGFEGMHVGGKRRLFVPYQLAYGVNGHPPVIPGKSELIFDMELVSMSAEDPTPTRPAGAPPQPGQLRQPGQPGSDALPSSRPATPPSGTAPGTSPSAPATAPTTPPTSSAPPPSSTAPKPPSGSQR